MPMSGWLLLTIRNKFVFLPYISDKKVFQKKIIRLGR